MPVLRGKALVAYILVCLLWGSTYLAIRIGVGVLPAFLFAGTRFLIAGLILLVAALLVRDPFPTRAADWGVLVLVGLLLLAGGNSFVVWAEQFTPSGVASLFVVAVALWMAIFDAILPGGHPLDWRVVTGLAGGFAGCALLVGASPAELLRADLRGPVALTLASASWAAGSVLYKRRHPAAGLYATTSIEMIAGGLVVTILALAGGEGARFHLTPTGAGALAYLVVFGSIVGYSAYSYALRHAPPAVVGTYAYVNPVIAVILGYAILDESITVRTVLAMVLILGSVIWIQVSHSLLARRTAVPAGAD